MTNGNAVGIRVGDPTARVWCNTTNGNRSDGINVHGVATGQTTRVEENTANNNAQYGINAVEGTIDGGGNAATGNGTNCTPNYFVCGPPPSTCPVSAGA